MEDLLGHLMAHPAGLVLVQGSFVKRTHPFFHVVLLALRASLFALLPTRVSNEIGAHLGMRHAGIGHRRWEHYISAQHPILDVTRSTVMMDGAMGSMMGWMMALGLLGWALVIALLVTIV
ncbi:MAG: hypothetical protein ACRD5W_10490, partial [Candidatus Acidiferrales bacterium]